MPRVLVTGGSGLIGAALLPALRAAGWTTRCLVHRSPIAAADEIATGDLRVPGSLRQASEGVDAVIHLAAVTHARTRAGYFEANVEGTRNLLAASGRERLRRFVLVSSRAASESGGHYGQSKLRAEELVQEAGLPFAILRLAEVYGTGSDEGVDQIVSRAARGRAVPVVGSGGQRICPVELSDAIAPIVNALGADVAAGKTYTLAGECMTVREFAGACVEASAAGSRIVSIPRPAVRLLSALAKVAPVPIAPDQLARLEAPKHEGSPEARAELGFSPRPLQEGLREHCRRRA